jgi:hypothetical protein
MSRLTHLRHEFVEFIPDRLEPAVLYISRRYATAAHLCCCGCGLEVVTPLNPAKWSLFERDGTISLRPSVGNWSFPCQSHYWIDGNSVCWADTLSSSAIAQVKARDRRDAEILSNVSKGQLAAIWHCITKIVSRSISYVKWWWKR